MAISVKLGERKVWKVNVGVASTGTRDHTKLENRDKADQHPINSISGLEKALSQKAAAQDMKGHVDNKQNPHGLTAEQVGARPSDWMPTAEQVGARPSDWMPTAEQVGARPSDWMPTAEQVGARPDNWMPSASEVGARPNTWLPTLEQIGAAPALDWSHLKWYVMGDSLTAQDNAFTDKRYYDFVQEKTGIQVIVDGVGATGYKAGESEGQSFLDRVKNIPEDVDIVTIFGSGNDLTSTDLTYANDAIYNTLAWILLNRTGLRVIVVPPTPWRNYDKRGEVWKAYCDRLQLCALTCDFRYLSEVYDCPPFNGKYDSHVEKFFTNDPNGVHPNEEGHKALAPYFYNALLEELALDKGVVVSPGGSGGSGGAVDIPTALPNPHKLTFTGAVQAEYDGSKEVTVKIPEGGSGGGIEVTGASVGQIIVVKAVDENGKPTEWETADLPQGGGGATPTAAEKIVDYTVDADGADALIFGFTVAEYPALAEYNHLKGVVKRATNAGMPWVNVQANGNILGQASKGANGLFAFEICKHGNYYMGWISSPQNTSLYSAWLVNAQSPTGGNAPIFPIKIDALTKIEVTSWSKFLDEGATIEIWGWNE